MKQFIAIIAAAFAVTAFAQAPAAKKEEAKPATAVNTPAPAASAAPAKKDEPKKADTKSAPAGDKKAEAAKK